MQSALLEATASHPHARAILTAAAPPAGRPSHAYLFHGPPGTGKRTAARAFAATLLLEGAASPELAAERVARATHPDLTWVTPSGSSELLVSDIDEPVVAAATRTPFESTRRVFVIEAAGTMNDQAANRLLKTLEEPPAYAHLILLAEHVEDVLATIASRCQQVRFDPLASEQLERRLASKPGQSLPAATLAACARLAAGDGALAERLASEEGAALRACGEALARAALGSGETSALDDRDPDGGGDRPWTGLLAAAKRAGEDAARQVGEQLRRQAELLPAKERRKHEREGGEALRRSERRARAATLDLVLRLAELWLRDVWCVAIGAGDLVLAVDRREAIEADAHAIARLDDEGRAPAALRRAVELVAETRLRLPLNVSEELAVEALAYGLKEAIGPAIGPRLG